MKENEGRGRERKDGGRRRKEEEKNVRKYSMRGDVRKNARRCVRYIDCQKEDTSGRMSERMSSERMSERRSEKKSRQKECRQKE